MIQIDKNNLYSDLYTMANLKIEDKLEIDNASGQFVISKNTYGAYAQSTERFISGWSGYYITDHDQIFGKLNQVSIDVYEYALNLIGFYKQDNEESTAPIRELMNKLVWAIDGLGKLKITYLNEDRVNVCLEQISATKQTLAETIYPQKENITVIDKHITIIEDYQHFSLAKEIRETILKLQLCFQSDKNPFLIKGWNGNHKSLDLQLKCFTLLPYREGIEHFRRMSFNSESITLDASKDFSYLPLTGAYLGSGAFKKFNLSIRYPTPEDTQIISTSSNQTNPFPVQIVATGTIKRPDIASILKEKNIYLLLKDSPYFVKFIDMFEYFSKAGEKRVKLYIQWCNKGDLDQYINELSEKTTEEKNYIIYHIMSDILHGLKVMHDKGINHQDMKGGNILIHEDAAGKIHAEISDFGLSEMVVDQLESYLVALTGTPAFYSPELSKIRSQASRFLVLNRKANSTYLTSQKRNVWATGMILYKLITGKNLYSLPLYAELLPDMNQADMDIFFGGSKEILLDSPFYPLMRAMLAPSFYHRPMPQTCLDIFNRIDPAIGQKP